MLTKRRFPSRLASQLQLSAVERRHWEWANLGMLLVLVSTATLLSLMAWLTDWDLALADATFDARIKAFPLRHAWVTEVFNHVILRRLFTVVALGFLAVVLWDLLSTRRWSWLRRFQMRVVALSAVLVPVVISSLKQMSDTHCPWDLQRYGGTAPYVRLFESLPALVEPGHCMPAGHASSALWLISISIYFLPKQLGRGALTLAAFLAVGFAVGWMQQLRGAHFLTHTLWSLWVALATVFIVITCMDRWPER